MLMKYLYLQTLSRNDSILPLFVDLRDLNEYPDKPLFEFLVSEMQHRIETFTSDQFKYALREGYIVLFLDGYDEIDYDSAYKTGKRNTEYIQ
jgi:hypothetical protein